MPSVRVLADAADGKGSDSVKKSQVERCKANGIIALADCGLTFMQAHTFSVGIYKTIPEEVWTCKPSARVLDLSNNSLHEVPIAIGCLNSLQKLLLSGNHLLDNSVKWEGITSLKSLTVLSLNQNNLTLLPSELGALTCLRHLHIANNQLMCIPSEIGLLTELQVLKVENNRIKNIPQSIGGCISLVEVDLSCNLLIELPETFVSLKSLKALYLSNNGMKSLPSNLFRMCLQLSTLDLHGTEITMDLLRQFEGWESFDKRRRLKHQKQLDFRVTGSAEFDEGADKNW